MRHEQSGEPNGSWDGPGASLDLFKTIVHFFQRSLLGHTFLRNPRMGQDLRDGKALFRVRNQDFPNQILGLFADREPRIIVRTITKVKVRSLDFFKLRYEDG